MTHGLTAFARAALTLLVATFATAAPAHEAAYDLAIVNVTVVSPERAAPLANANVYIRGDRIARIEANARPRLAARTIDGRGRYLIPGLIDSHVHVASLPGPNGRQARALPGLVADIRRQVPRSYLYFGFTSLVDPDLAPETRSWFEAGEHPALYGCGRGVRLIDGYGMNFVEPEERLEVFPNFVADPGAELPEGVVPEAATPEAAAERIARDGGICLKTYFERGFGGVFDLPVPSGWTMAALVRAARARGLPVMLHATAAEGYRAALDMRADIIAHGLWHWPGPIDAEPPADVVALIGAAARSGAVMQPTLQVLHGEQAIITGDALRDPRLAEAAPPSLIAWFASPQGGWYREELAELYARVGTDPALSDEQAIAIFIARARATLAEYMRQGGRIIFGSDTPASPGAGNIPGLNGLREIERLIEAGLSAEYLFQALTLQNARAFGLDHEIGSVEASKRADLLLLSADPRRDPTAYDTIEAIIVRGRLISRSSLAADASGGNPYRESPPS